MKHVGICFGSWIGLVPLVAWTQELATLEVRVTGMRQERGGVLYVHVLNDAGERVGAERVSITGHTAVAHFRSVSPGRHAVRCFADENGNGKLDFGFMGIPKEGVGHSNNAKGFFSAPKLKDMLFNVAGHTTIELNMSYY